MDIDTGLIALGTIGLFFLIMFIFFSVRMKSMWAGLVISAALFPVLLLIVAPIIVLISPIFLYQYIPEHIQIEIGLFSSIIGPFFIIALVFIPNSRRLRKVGNFLTPNGQTKTAQLAQGAAMFLLVYCQLTVAIDMLYRLNADESYRRNIFWWIVMICLAVYFYHSLEWREKGFVYRGKVFLFSDVEFAKWDSLWYKTKLKVQLKNNEQELTLNIPPEMTAAIDDSLRSKFPPP